VDLGDSSAAKTAGHQPAVSKRPCDKKSGAGQRLSA
jgi:hypothetical protein